MSIVSCVRDVVCDYSSNGLYFDDVFVIENILYVGYGKLFIRQSFVGGCVVVM